VLDRAAERGDIQASTDRSFVVSALMGPLYYRRWFAREPIDDRFVADLVRSVLGGLGVSRPTVTVKPRHDEIRPGV
jgi:hypothetical protein